MAAKSKTPTHKWQFKARFRRHAFGWRSQLAIKRVKEAVSEIKKVARKDKALAAEGAVSFLEKVSPAFEPSMTVREVANYLNVDDKTVYRLAQKGDLPGFKVAGTWRFKREDIDQWIEDQKRAAVQKEGGE